MILSDYVIDFLRKKGIDDIFLVSGGGIMFLMDSVGRKMRYISNHHEQACTIGAEAYARVRNDVGACLVTTGPGATNAITGVACAWFDSIPLIILSGQQRRELIADYTKVRNIGPQEANIIPMVTPITKYTKTILRSETIRYELEKAYYIATTGRPGPVWLDFPLDVQGEEVEVSKLRGFTPKKKKEDNRRLRKSVAHVIELLKKAKRPILILGNGIRLAKGEVILRKFLDKVSIPIILPFNGLDLIAEKNPLLVGKFGPGGQRRGNFALQNSDLVLSVGASLNVASIGFNYMAVAPKAKKIMVNVDRGELTKKTLAVDFPIQADAKDFLEEFLKQVKKHTLKISSKWLGACSAWKKRYPSVTEDFYKDKKHVNSYVFFDKLSDRLDKEDVLVTGIGLDTVSMYQAFRVKEGQRAFVNKNFGPMGWCLPAAVGACFGHKKKRTILVTGDGSLQVNIQELETIKYYRLPIKIFVFNNGGYESIRATQSNFFNGRFVGSDEGSGVSNPNFKLLAATYGFTYEKITNNEQIEKTLKKTLTVKGAVLCEVNIDYSQKRIPKASSFRRPDGKLESRPLEDMAPFLPREEISENMHLFDNEDQ